MRIMNIGKNDNRVIVCRLHDSLLRKINKLLRKFSKVTKDQYRKISGFLIGQQLHEVDKFLGTNLTRKLNDRYKLLNFN